MIDSSLWIAIYRDISGQIGARVAERVGGEGVAMLPPIAMELLQGARDENEWRRLSSEINKLPSLALAPDCWALSARLYFDLRRAGGTVRGSIDCLIAQSCL